MQVISARGRVRRSRFAGHIPIAPFPVLNVQIADHSTTGAGIRADRWPPPKITASEREYSRLLYRNAAPQLIEKVQHDGDVNRFIAAPGFHCRENHCPLTIRR